MSSVLATPAQEAEACRVSLLNLFVLISSNAQLKQSKEMRGSSMAPKKKQASATQQNFHEDEEITKLRTATVSPVFQEKFLRNAEPTSLGLVQLLPDASVEDGHILLNPLKYGLKKLMILNAEKQFVLHSQLLLLKPLLLSVAIMFLPNILSYSKINLKRLQKPEMASKRSKSWASTTSSTAPQKKFYMQAVHEDEDAAPEEKKDPYLLFQIPVHSSTPCKIFPVLMLFRCTN